MARTVRYLVSLTPQEVRSAFERVCAAEPRRKLAVETEPGGFCVRRTTIAPPSSDYSIVPLILCVRLAARDDGTLVTAKTVATAGWRATVFAIGATVLFFGVNLLLDARDAGARRRRERSELLNLVAQLLAPYEVGGPAGPYRDGNDPA